MSPTPSWKRPGRRKGPVAEAGGSMRRSTNDSMSLLCKILTGYGMLRSPKSCRLTPGRVTLTDTLCPAGSGRS